MNMNHEIIPRLRFPEFHNLKEWKNKPLKEIALRITNGKANAEDHEEGGIYPLFDRSETIKKSNSFMFDAEAVIIPGEGMKFQPRYFNGKFNLHQRAYALMNFNGSASFIFYAVDFLKNELAKKAVQSTVLSLRLPIIENFSVPISGEKEQQKIADCLSSIDELISAEARKLDALKAHKKGLMQQLFPAEGETVPRLRFPEFRDAGEWKEKKISDVLMEAVRPFEMEDDEEYSLVIVKRRYEGIVSRGKFQGKLIKVKSQFLLQKDDFLISKRQIVHCACGLVPEEFDGAIVSNEYSVLRAKNGFYIKFFEYFCRQPAVGRSFLECSIGIVIEKMLFKLRKLFTNRF